MNDNMDSDKLIQKRALTVDDVFNVVGGFNRYQWIIVVVFSVMLLPYVFQILITYFTALDPDWRCVANSTVCLFNDTMSSNHKYRCGIPRSEWQYTISRDSSIATQFDLNCERKWMHHLLTSIIFVGWGIGAVLFGYLADNYGRRKVLLSAYSTLVLVSFLTSFMPNFALIAFIIGMCIPGIQVQGFTIISELVSDKERGKAVLIPGVWWSVALCLVPLHAYFIRKWKTLQIVCSAPYFIMILVGVLFIPESVRWLRLKGRTGDVLETFNKIAKYNKREIPENVDIAAVATEISPCKSTPLDVFATRTMASRSMAQGYIWFASGLVYYGLALAAKDLGGSMYLNFFLLTIVQIPACIWAIDLCHRYGRKKTTMFSMFIACISCVVIAATPVRGKVKVVRVIFGMVGKFFISIEFATIYLWAMELYPTNIRSSGNGFLQVTSRMGAATSPWVAKGLLSLHLSAPFIVLAVVSLVSTGITFLLPETKNIPIADTVEDIEQNNSPTTPLTGDVMQSDKTAELITSK